MKTPKITFTIETMPEDVPVRGNVLASGNDAIDRKAEDEILADLESGNEWAWCTVKVTAKCAGYEGVDYLGCCSYENEEQFRQPGGYFDDMKREALQAMVNNLEAASLLFHELETLIDSGEIFATI